MLVTTIVGITIAVIIIVTAGIVITLWQTGVLFSPKEWGPFKKIQTIDGLVRYDFMNVVTNNTASHFITTQSTEDKENTIVVYGKGTDGKYTEIDRGGIDGTNIIYASSISADGSRVFASTQQVSGQLSFGTAAKPLSGWKTIAKDPFFMGTAFFEDDDNTKLWLVGLKLETRSTFVQFVDATESKSFETENPDKILLGRLWFRNGNYVIMTNVDGEIQVYNRTTEDATFKYRKNFTVVDHSETYPSSVTISADGEWVVIGDSLFTVDGKEGAGMVTIGKWDGAKYNVHQKIWSKTPARLDGVGVRVEMIGNDLLNIARQNFVLEADKNTTEIYVLKDDKFTLLSTLEGQYTTMGDSSSMGGNGIFGKSFGFTNKNTVRFITYEYNVDSDAGTENAHIYIYESTKQ